MSKIDDKLNEVLGIAEIDKTFENEVLPKKIRLVEEIFIIYLIKVMKQLMVYSVLQKKENILVLMKLQVN